MAFVAGNNAKVAIGSTTVLGMGNWKFSGITVDLLESTAFGDTAKQFMTGLLDYGEATFGGLYDLSNAGAQSTLLSALMNNSKVGDIRFYLNSVSYWTPNITVLSAAGMLVRQASIGQDKSGLGTVEFTGKFTGPMLLV
jgi:hypothetical protein